MSIGDVVVLLMIIGVGALAFRSIRKSKKSGCTGCCAACGQACARRNTELQEK